MTRWIALGPTGTGVLACGMEGGSLLQTVTAQSEAEALAALDMPDAKILRIGDGAPTTVPTQLLPETGQSVPAAEQTTPPDILTGWVRIWCAGVVAEAPNWDGVICVVTADLSQWVHISAGEMISLQSFLTPRLIATLGGATPPDAEALSDSLSRPERIAAHLRAAEVLGAPAAITGHLIGAELMAARPYWLGQNVVLLGETTDSVSAHATALESQHVPYEQTLTEDVLPKGLAALASKFL